MRGRACVDMRGPTPGLQRTCDVACLHSCEGLGCAKHRPLSQLVGDLCTHNRCVVRLWRTQVEHAQGYEARAHLDLFAWSAGVQGQLGAFKRASDSVNASIECTSRAAQ